MSRHMQVRTTVRLPRDLLDRARHKATAEGRTLTALIEDGLRRVVTEKPKPLPPNRIEIPVSKATGGLQPGMENLTFSQLQELDDLEYVERLRKGFQ